MRKEIKKIVKTAKALGWGVIYKNHITLINLEGRKVFVPSTPSDQRALKNLKSVLRKYGYEE